MPFISPSFFGQLLGTSPLITITPESLIVSVNGSERYIKWHELLSPITFEFGFLGQIVHFRTASNAYKFSMMTYSCRYHLQVRCTQYWVNNNLSRLEQLLMKIAKASSQRFLRQSTVRQIKTAVELEASRWLPWIKQSKDFASLSVQINSLEQYRHWNNEQTLALQERYIHQQMNRYKTFFDHVESNPLTERQRRACIIDDDNNLLLAGAGTGKTSVMVGRTGYLVESKQANYHDILLLAYGRKAADEMDARIKDKLATNKISASTFHRLGLNIIAQVEGQKPRLSRFAEDELFKRKWVENYFEALIAKHEQYREWVLSYFSQYYYAEKNNNDFNTLGDYYQYLNDNDVRSLKGDKVQSFEELYIANWLFYHGVDYEYKAAYQFNVQTVARKQYQPKFYLPEFNLYIEYFAIDTNGETAAYIDRDEYYAVMQWKIAIHEQHKTQCIALTFADHQKGILLDKLKSCLSKQSIYLDRLPSSAILSSLKETGRITVLAGLFSELMSLYKAAHGNSNQVQKIITNAQDPKQMKQALELLQPILSAYNTYLQNQGEIDFDDMIVKAISYVESGQYRSLWRYIMVDEFQDISEPRARLVKALRDSHKGSSVFAVGDDWQAIYRFSGADVTLTTKFDAYFGDTTKTELDLTFRFNEHIGKVAADFISENPAQLNKIISSLKQVSAPAVSILRRKAAQGTEKNRVVELNNGAIDDVLSAISKKECKPVSVFLLARFWFQLPEKNDITRLSTQYPLLKIETESFHSSKGKEADYVVIIGLQKGKHGFPSEKLTPPIIDALLAPQEPFAHAEERRLFYVALTRAKKRVYIVADMLNASCFVDELILKHDVQLNEFVCEDEQLDTVDTWCVRCHTGKLTPRYGQYGNFYSCSFFPLCEHTEKPCQQCGSRMTRNRYPGFSLCLNQQCKHVLPICTQCGANMVLRQSKNEEFWGCQNYRGYRRGNDLDNNRANEKSNNSISCKNSLSASKIKWPELN